MVSTHEMQKTDTFMEDAQSYDKPATLGTQMQHIGTQVKETMQAAGTQVYEQGRESLQGLNRTLEGQIRQRPLQALLVAGGIGVLLGFLWQRS
jgi:ElaB/YqjD/DUF883 family membrane-anchored ribosome-binding protein